MTAGLTLRLASAMLILGLGGCSTNCISSDQKLARLTPGMSYSDVSAVMGCARAGRSADRWSPATPTP